MHILLQFGFTLFLEALIGLLQEREVVVKRFHIEGSIDVQVAVVGNGIAKGSAVIKFRATHPGIGSVIAGIALDPVEDG